MNIFICYDAEEAFACFCVTHFNFTIKVQLIVLNSGLCITEVILYTKEDQMQKNGSRCTVKEYFKKVRWHKTSFMSALRGC